MPKKRKELPPIGDIEIPEEAAKVPCNTCQQLAGFPCRTLVGNEPMDGLTHVSRKTAYRRYLRRIERMSNGV